MSITISSIEAYHEHQTKEAQREAVARFILKETESGQWTWITKISKNAEKIGHPGLSQTGCAAARLNEIKKRGAKIDGFDYVLVKAQVRWKPPGSKTAIEQWAMVLKSSQPKK